MIGETEKKRKEEMVFEWKMIGAYQMSVSAVGVGIVGINYQVRKEDVILMQIQYWAIHCHWW